ncbi:MAG: hypothetical protein PHY09_07250 [Desulfuromonadaceae bacterium]|nr:hypothetical protein [Desulfuromonadaceae bacterium]MDD5106381.1 hypothetical protein [Desulfuromonadaceae bacterium]
MKHKIIILLSFILCAAGTAFAGGVPAAPFTFKPSNNVTIAYVVDSATAAQKYAAASKNTAGNRFYYSANDNSNIYFAEASTNIGKSATDTLATTPIADGVLTVGSDWTIQ